MTLSIDIYIVVIVIVIVAAAAPPFSTIDAASAFDLPPQSTLLTLKVDDDNAHVAPLGFRCAVVCARQRDSTPRAPHTYVCDRKKMNIP